MQKIVHARELLSKKIIEFERISIQDVIEWNGITRCMKKLKFFVRFKYVKNGQ